MVTSYSLSSSWSTSCASSLLLCKVRRTSRYIRRCQRSFDFLVYSSDEQRDFLLQMTNDLFESSLTELGNTLFIPALLRTFLRRCNASSRRRRPEQRVTSFSTNYQRHHSRPWSVSHYFVLSPPTMSPAVIGFACMSSATAQEEGIWPISKPLPLPLPIGQPMRQNVLHVRRSGTNEWQFC